MRTGKSCHPTHRPHTAMYAYNCSTGSCYMDQGDRPIIQMLVDLCSCAAVTVRTHTRVHTHLTYLKNN